MESNTGLLYLEAPPRAPGQGTPPLLILLHGVGSHEGDLFSLAPAFDPRFHIVSLRAPLVLGPSSFGWFHVQFTAAGPAHNPAEAEASRELLITGIEELVAATGTDPDQVYVLGFSQGAIMGLYLGLTEPNLLAGVVAIAGRTLPEARDRLALPLDLRRLPVLVVHGVYDETLPIAHARATRDFLQTLPVSLTYREYPMGHEIDEASLADVTAWLTAQLDPSDPAGTADV